MARNKRQLSNAFTQLSNNEQEDVIEESNNEQETEVVTPQDTPENAQKAVEEVLEEVEDNSSTTVKDVVARFQEKYKEKVNKPTVEETHTRTTFLFRNDLAKRLEKLSRNKRGYKTQFINEAIEALLNEIE